MDKDIQRLKDLLVRVDGWVRFAEAKHGAALGLCSAAVWGLWGEFGKKGATADVRLVCAAALVFFAAAMVVSLLSFFPVTKCKDCSRCRWAGSWDKVSLYYFKDLKSFDPDSLLRVFVARYGASAGIVESLEARDLCCQVIVNACICYRKFSLSKIVVGLVLIGFAISCSLFFYGAQL